MSEQHGLSHHPAPHRDQVMLREALFGLLGAPIAWFIQLGLSYALFAVPCFPDADRRLALTAEGVWWAAIIAYGVCLLVAGASILVSLRLLRITRGEVEGGRSDLLEYGKGRTRFLSLWGLLLGIGFGFAILVTGFALIMVPACAL